MAKLKVLDLFSGIGGFSLGLERTGHFETVAFVEIDPFCRRVLAKHWPDVPIHEDIRELDGEAVGDVDIIVGGFPCQDISYAGHGVGIGGERSGLWSEYARLIGELRPRYVIVENVSALLTRGMGRVLGELSEIRYDAEWHCIPASTIGAPHRRDRVWIIAYPCKLRLEAEPDKNELRCPTLYGGMSRRLSQMGSSRHWDSPRPIGARPMGVDNGVSGELGRIRALGNAVVPQLVQVIGTAIAQVARPKSLNPSFGVNELGDD